MSCSMYRYILIHIVLCVCVNYILSRFSDNLIIITNKFKVNDKSYY